MNRVRTDAIYLMQGKCLLNLKGIAEKYWNYCIFDLDEVLLSLTMQLAHRVSRFCATIKHAALLIHCPYFDIISELQ